MPDQHAAFGITRATQAKKEVQWRDLGLEQLVNQGPNKEGQGMAGKVGKGAGSGSVSGLPR